MKPPRHRQRHQPHDRRTATNDDAHSATRYGTPGLHRMEALLCGFVAIRIPINSASLAACRRRPLKKAVEIGGYRSLLQNLAIAGWASNKADERPCEYRVSSSCTLSGLADSLLSRPPAFYFRSVSNFSFEFRQRPAWFLPRCTRRLPLPRTSVGSPWRGLRVTFLLPPSPPSPGRSVLGATRSNAGFRQHQGAGVLLLWPLPTSDVRRISVACFTPIAWSLCVGRYEIKRRLSAAPRHCRASCSPSPYLPRTPLLAMPSLSAMPSSPVMPSSPSMA